MTKHPPVGRRIADFESQDTTPSTVVLSANVQLVCARIWASKLLRYASVIPLLSRRLPEESERYLRVFTGTASTRLHWHSSRRSPVLTLAIL